MRDLAKTARPLNSFVVAVGRLLDIVGAFDNPFATSTESSVEIDNRAIASDWWQVGQDMHKAFKEVPGRCPGLPPLDISELDRALTWDDASRIRRPDPQSMAG